MCEEAGYSPMDLKLSFPNSNCHRNPKLFTEALVCSLDHAWHLCSHLLWQPSSALLSIYMDQMTRCGWMHELQLKKRVCCITKINLWWVLMGISNFVRDSLRDVCKIGKTSVLFKVPLIYSVSKQLHTSILVKRPCNFHGFVSEVWGNSFHHICSFKREVWSSGQEKVCKLVGISRFSVLVYNKMWFIHSPSHMCLGHWLKTVMIWLTSKNNLWQVLPVVANLSCTRVQDEIWTVQQECLVWSLQKFPQYLYWVTIRILIGAFTQGPNIAKHAEPKHPPTPHCTSNSSFAATTISITTSRSLQ